MAGLAARCVPPSLQVHRATDPGRIGPLVADPLEPGGKGRPLCSFESIVDHIGRAELVPRPEAEARFLGRLEFAPGVRAYIRRPDKFAQEAGPFPRQFFDRFKALAGFDGGVLRGGTPDEVRAWQHAALLTSDAADLFGYGADTTAPPAEVAPLCLVASPEPAPSAPDPRIVQPAGSTWEVCRKRPGDPKRPWSEEEKAAMRAMRASMTDTEIGDVAGVSREAIRHAIGSRNPRGASRAMGGIALALVKR